MNASDVKREILKLECVTRLLTIPHLVRSSATSPFFRLRFAAHCCGLGSKERKLFALDCVVLLMSLVSSDMPGFEDLSNCVSDTREHVRSPSKRSARELRERALRISNATFSTSGTSSREFCVRSACGFVLPVINLGHGPIGPDAPRFWNSAGVALLASKTTAESLVRYLTLESAARGAYTQCWHDLSDERWEDHMRGFVASWCAEYSATLVHYYLRTRLPGWTASESYEFGVEAAESDGTTLKSLLHLMPSDLFSDVSEVVRRANRAAFQRHIGFAEGTRSKALELLASRLGAYVLNPPEPWQIGSRSVRLEIDKIAAEVYSEQV